MKTRILLSVSLITLLAVAAGYGQSLVASITANINFPFTVEGKILPAGEYKFVRTDSGSAFIVESGVRHVATALVLTRLSRAMHTTPEDSHIVFDKVGDTYTLAEIWAPNEDGFVLAMTKTPHEHHVVNVRK
ncbi:MAG: hypothetical protein LLG20_07680 [Acidobacteriales bacterium]|nr:hypothetical protein [Terriglobales bacterium]